LNPFTARPIAVPTMEDSASGELKTRSGPKRVERPVVAVKTPPFLSSMSSP